MNDRLAKGGDPAKQPYAGYYLRHDRSISEADPELTQTGPNTPMGEYLRRFWQPVCLAQELTEVPKAIRIMGENLIAFRDRSDARSFGVATCGLTTGNQSFFLSDGASLILTVSTMADRSLKAYGGVLVPDEVIDDPAQTVARAVSWLETGR